jgi:hypothetical protein
MISETNKSLFLLSSNISNNLDGKKYAIAFKNVTTRWLRWASYR